MKNIVLFSMLCMPLMVLGQYNETIRTARPGRAIGTFAVGKNVLQIQSGLTHREAEFDENSKTKTWAHGTVLRFGLLEKLEVSGVVIWQKDDITSPEEGLIFSGISNTQLGARYHILDNKGAIPALGIQGRVLLKAQSSEYRRDKMGSRFILATGNKINRWLSIGTNVGLTWSGNNQNPQSLFAAKLSFKLAEKIKAFTEVYGSFGGFDTNFDGGFSYRINKNVQVDLSGGWQGAQGLTDWFIDSGVAFRLDWRE